MGEFIDLTGQRFGRLVVLRKYGVDNHKKISWTCICDCGTEKNILGMSLRTKRTKSCGCIYQDMDRSFMIRHGHAMKDKFTPEYNTWRGMNDRCGNPNHTSYINYGGRGITVEWKSFDEFYNDMGNRPSPNHSIDRLDVNGNYCKGNCAWATPTEQVRNRRKNKNNSSGTTGVYWYESNKKWGALITLDRKRIHLGLFEKLADAIKVRKEAEKQYWQ